MMRELLLLFKREIDEGAMDVGIMYTSALCSGSTVGSNHRSPWASRACIRLRGSPGELPNHKKGTYLRRVYRI